MKSPIRQSVSFVLVWLYVITAIAAAGSALRTDQPLQGNAGGMQFSVVSGDYLYSLPQSNTLAFPARHNDGPAAIKVLLHGLSAVEQPEALAGVAFLACYLRQAAGFPVHLRKSDLIFPFHYFW